MGLGAVPEDQQRPLEGDLMALKNATTCSFLMLPSCRPNRKLTRVRPVLPVEVKLDNRGLSLRCASAHSGQALAQARFVDEHDQATFALGFLLSRGQVRRCHSRTAISLRSMARRSSVNCPASSLAGRPRQRIDAPCIKQRLPRVHRLPRQPRPARSPSWVSRPAPHTTASSLRPIGF